MSVTFANLAGFWALLGIPAILAIHFLQKQSQLLTISTLFLLEQLRRESVSGRRFERLRSSIPLWLQILAVLILTWMLVQPRWVRPDSVQRIAIVLDSSASMSAFRDNLEKQLRTELNRLAQAARRTEYAVIDSQVAGQSIYSGTAIDDLMKALAEWSPAGGDHDFGPALRVGRSLVRGDGLVVLATDHLHEDLPYDARLLAIGEKKDNVGFAGLNIVENEDGETLWQAIVKNYSDSPQTRSWVMQAGQQRTEDRSITLEPGEVRSLQGRFPEAADAVVLRLQPDDFTFDDSLPAVRPAPKPFAIAKISPPELDETFAQILGSFDQLVPPSEENPPDLALVAHDPLDPKPLPARAIVVNHHRGVAEKYLSGRLVAENHPLMDGLNWQGLISRQTPGIPRAETDTVLLWQGDRALIFLRTAEGARQLCFNFDLATSNATRQPAFIVLLHRFVGDLRAQKVAPETLNFEINQPVPLAFATGEGIPAELSLTETGVSLAQAASSTETIPVSRSALLRAPARPSFFEIAQGETPGVLIRAASHFADTREADLSRAATRSDLAGIETTLVDQHTERDANWPLWLLLLLAALLASWYYVNRPSVASGAVSSSAPA
jgi:hypothetical protein